MLMVSSDLKLMAPTGNLLNMLLAIKLSLCNLKLPGAAILPLSKISIATGVLKCEYMYLLPMMGGSIKNFGWLGPICIHQGTCYPIPPPLYTYITALSLTVTVKKLLSCSYNVSHPASPMCVRLCHICQSNSNNSLHMILTPMLDASADTNS